MYVQTKYKKFTIKKNKKTTIKEMFVHTVYKIIMTRKMSFVKKLRKNFHL